MLWANSSGSNGKIRGSIWPMTASTRLMRGPGGRFTEDFHGKSKLCFGGQERPMIDSLRQDVRLALRGIRRSPAFAAVVIATIALAVGANTAVFSIFNAIVLRALPVREPSRLVLLTPIEERGTATRFVYRA